MEQRQLSASGNLIRRWAGYIGLTTAVGLAYFLIAELGLGLYGQTNFVSVFWPGFGLSAGVLIALGAEQLIETLQWDRRRVDAEAHAGLEHTRAHVTAVIGLSVPQPTRGTRR